MKFFLVDPPSRFKAAEEDMETMELDGENHLRTPLLSPFFYLSLFIPTLISSLTLFVVVGGRTLVVLPSETLFPFCSS